MTEPGIHQQPRSWSDNADHYQSMFAPFSQGAAAAALQRIELQPGERFLDVAAGTGAVTLRAAALGAQVVALTSAEEMTAALTTAGFDQIHTEVITVPFPVRDPAEFWQRWALRAPPTLRIIEQLEPELLPVAGEHFLELFAAETGGSEATFATDVLLGSGTVNPKESA